MDAIGLALYTAYAVAFLLALVIGAIVLYAELQKRSRFKHKPAH